MGLATAFGDAGALPALSGIPVLRGLRASRSSAPGRRRWLWGQACLRPGCRDENGGASLVRIALALTVVDLVAQAWRARSDRPARGLHHPRRRSRHICAPSRGTRRGFRPGCGPLPGCPSARASRAGRCRGTGAARTCRPGPGNGAGSRDRDGRRTAAAPCERPSPVCEPEVRRAGRGRSGDLGEPQRGRAGQIGPGRVLRRNPAGDPAAGIHRRSHRGFPQEALSALFSPAFDPRRAVILEADRRAAEGLGRPGGKVSVLSRSPSPPSISPSASPRAAFSCSSTPSPGDGASRWSEPQGRCLPGADLRLPGGPVPGRHPSRDVSMPPRASGKASPS